MSGLLATKSTTILIPWKTVPAQLFFSNSLKFSGQPFFNISLACSPLICIMALEWEISVTAKFSLSHVSVIVLVIFTFLETRKSLRSKGNQGEYLGHFQRSWMLWLHSMCRLTCVYTFTALESPCRCLIEYYSEQVIVSN